VSPDALPTDDGETTSDRIRLTLPAETSYARVARLALTGLASRNGFTYDEVEDIRIAVGEVFGLLVADAAHRNQVEFSCSVSPEMLDVVVRRVPPQPLGDVSDLTQQILAAVVDVAEIDAPEGAVRLVKRQELDR
jgi:hypothetical protein